MINWIRVKEHLPPSNDRVLVASETGEVTINYGRRVIALYLEADADGEDCFYTHWMPLPASPTDGSSKDSK